MMREMDKYRTKINAFMQGIFNKQPLTSLRIVNGITIGILARIIGSVYAKINYTTMSQEKIDEA